MYLLKCTHASFPGCHVKPGVIAPYYPAGEALGPSTRKGIVRLEGLSTESTFPSRACESDLDWILEVLDQESQAIELDEGVSYQYKSTLT